MSEVDDKFSIAKWWSDSELVTKISTILVIGFIIAVALTFFGINVMGGTQSGPAYPTDNYMDRPY